MEKRIRKRLLKTFRYYKQSLNAISKNKVGVAIKKLNNKRSKNYKITSIFHYNSCRNSTEFTY